MNLSEIVKPSWLINTETVKQNIERMKRKANAHNLTLRPHFKTHQSIEVGQLFLDAGIDKITVSSMDMAEEFMAAGFRDICLAIPFNAREIKRLNSVPEDITFYICVESQDLVNCLKDSLTRQTGIFIKTDCGYHRSGIDHADTNAFMDIIDSLASSSLMEFNGLLTHSGHTYNAGSVDEIKRIHTDVKEKMIHLKQKLGQEMILSIGDTPSMSICNEFEGIDEVRPGNFVYYDLMQHYLGACTIDQIAARAYAPVIGKNRERMEFILHAGAVHLSKEHLFTSDGTKNFGEAIAIHSGDHRIFIKQRPILIKLSQEHGTLSVDEATFNSCKHGDLIEILPIHACLCANLLKDSSHLI